MNIDELRAAVEPGFDSRESALELFKSEYREFPKIRNKPCSDCAVTEGLYAGLAACGYRHLDPEERLRLAKTWSCHNGGRCEGAYMVLVN